MDVNQQTVIDVMRQHQCQLLIHGHTHRPNRHQFMLDGQEATRLVLADWKKQSGEVLCWDGGEFRVEAV
jgi:UDP-2,3-diacylglucosamine hydrolase